jgi:hypothetical protein
MSIYINNNNNVNNNISTCVSVPQTFIKTKKANIFTKSHINILT